MKKLFIFDLDGTLVDAYKAIEISLNFTRRRLGYPLVNFQDVKRRVGRGDRLFMEAFFEKDDIKRALKIFRAHHKKSLLKHTKLKPYAKNLLYALKKRKKIIAIASNRPYYFTNLIVKKLGIKKYLDFILCADQINSLKPNPKILNMILKRFGIERIEAIYTGDMDIDLETAKRAGIDAIFVTGGSSTVKGVRKYRKKAVFSLKRIAELYKR